MLEYGFSKSVNEAIESLEIRVTEELKKEGFGILTRIDVKDKFKEKLDIDFQKYIILGACNPASAHKSILVEENIGLMLPCNVILYEKEGNTVVSIIKPGSAMSMIGNDRLNEIAVLVEEKLKRVFENI